MDPKDIGSLLIILICLAGSAFFSGSETAFSTFNRIRMKKLAQDGNRKAKRVLAMSEKYDTFISTVLIGNNIVNILLSSLATLLCVKWLKETSFASFVAAISTAVMTVVVLIFGEISPKNIAKEHADGYAMAVCDFIRFLEILFAPFNFIFGLWKKLVSVIFKSSDEHAVTEEELLSMVDEVEHSGGIGEQEGELIRNAMELNENDCADIATPRVDIEAVEKNWTKEEVAKVFVETGYSRLPVYVDSIDNIIGIIHRTDFYNNYDMENIADAILTKPVFVPTTMKIGALLKLLQKNKCHMAVVTDEYGGTFGIVTMEDILEELVGEIWDEHDEVEEDMSENKGIYTVSGSMDPEELFEELEMDIEEVPYATLGGWIMDELNKVPEVGDTFESNGYKFTVETVDGMRVDTAVVEKIETVSETEE